MRFTKVAALVMHVRPYRETSALIRCFTREQGVLVTVANGVRRSKQAGIYQPFSYGNLSCSGRGSLMTLTQFDALGRHELHGDALAAGFYVLELIDRCLTEHQVEAEIFAVVQETLAALALGAAMAASLRKFERVLLEQLGYGFDFEHDAQGAPIAKDTWYVWQTGIGFVPGPQQSGSAPGAVIQAIAESDYGNIEVLRFAKQINQAALQPLLGSRPLVSRALAQGARNRNS